MTTPTRRFALFAVVLAAVATLALAVPAVAHGGPGDGTEHGPASDWLAWMDEHLTPDHAAWMDEHAGTTGHHAGGTAPVDDGAYGPHHDGEETGYGTGPGYGC